MQISSYLCPVRPKEVRWADGQPKGRSQPSGHVSYIYMHIYAYVYLYIHVYICG